MIVSLDVRMIEHSGIGTMLKGLLSGFSNISDAPEFLLIKDTKNKFNYPLNLRFKEIYFSNSIYSIKSQIFYPKQINADILHYPHYNFPIMYKGKIIVNIHDLAHFHYPTSIFHKLYISYFLNKLRDNRIPIITGTNFIKNEIINYFHFPESQIDVIEQGIDGKLFSKPELDDIENFKKDRKLPQNYILSLGINKPHKNIEFLFRSLKRAELKDIVLIHCMPHERWLEGFKSLAKKHKIESKVIFLSALSSPDLVKLYAGSSAFVFPSLYEGFGLPPLEAMAIGVPVVSSNSQPMSEILSDAAIYFKPKNEDSLVNAIYNALTDSDIRKKHIAKGILQSQKYSWDIAAQKTIFAYQKCCQQ